MLFSQKKGGAFQAKLSASDPDLRESNNTELRPFVSRALSGNTRLKTITVDGKEYCMTGAPMGTVGWTAVSITDKEITHQPTVAMRRERTWQ